ncbi:glycoside hydrolase family 2 TIM barrel-domain containing protein [uncultured Bacteroides sp.]|uniref:glycoside hydrolase family 2 TIM barrel-domain containing protein n=1 Tax=uncultured Bacteroides sp. TaxID=162156 RepID=UPI002AAC1A41|nr:glycoside hydrolase family 2 TIM barrel-domain containing protein [uncultured Bacteroides sp.]
MKTRLLFFFIGAVGLLSTVNGQTVTQLIAGKDFPAEIENPECLGINKEPAHATLMPYGSLNEALVAKRHASSYCHVLNGMWKFNWAAWPNQRPVDFYKPTYDVSGWKEIPVPSNWQVLGYGTPYYRNMGYTFKIDFPHVMSEPPKNYTAYEERNPVGSYRRDFDLPADWNGRRTFITFDGVDAAFFIWINGQKVGYSTNSRNAAEFDITPYVKPGKNMVAVEVYRYCSGSYLEDQDMWRLSGIFRNVTLWSAPQTHVRDFFVQTDFDKDYRNSEVSVVAKVKNYGTVAVPARKLAASLYNGTQQVENASAVANVPAMKPGQESLVTLNFNVMNPEKWTAETPKLYTTVLTLQDSKGTVETLSSRTGFRKVEIKGRQLLVNGTPLKLKGVNRHEHWSETGHAVSEEQMIRDLEVLKQGNCNHVRTCHYSDDPRWYELCDEWGIWLVAEANVECHGCDGKFDEEPRMKAAIIDRNVANVENFKNHSSVIIWSLGNECGRVGSNFVSAMAAVKSIDPTRFVHYERFGIGKNNPSDFDGKMYGTPEAFAKIAQDKELTKPFYICEFAHAMFNSMGSLAEYSKVFDDNPEILGGAIWEWQDQGLWNRRNPERPILAYGGGFGEYPNNDYFIHKGVVFADRSPKPHYPEMKRAYQWIGITPADSSYKTFDIKNKYQFIDLNGFSASWTLSEDGKEIANGKITLPSIAPFNNASISIPWTVDNPKPGSEYFLRVSFKLNHDEQWAKNGYEVAAAQFILPVKAPLSANNVKNIAPLKMKQTDREITLVGSDFSLIFDKQTATFSEINDKGINFLKNGGGPKLHLTRAPHMNDDMWAFREWEKVGLDSLKWTASNVVVKKVNKSTYTISASLKAQGLNGFAVNHDVTYTISGDKKIICKNSVSTNKPELPIARMGVRMLLQPELNQFEYLGRGPMENYSDRKQGSDIGLYKSSVAQQLTPYEKPMEGGNHEDVRWGTVSNAANAGLTISAVEAPLQLCATPYSDEQLQEKFYRIDLPKSDWTVLCISQHTMGVGSNGCGPRPLEQYTVRAVPTIFTYVIQIK